MSRNRHWRCSINKAALKNLSKFIGKYLCWSLFLIKLFQQSCFPVNSAKFLRAPISKNLCERLVLSIVFNSNEEQYFFAKLDEMG